MDLNRELREHYNVQISNSAVKLILKESNFHGRLQFARAHKNWTLAQWAQMLFSDESKFNLHSSDEIQYVRCPIIQETGYSIKYSLLNTAVGTSWRGGCFSRYDISPLLMGSLTGSNIVQSLKTHAASCQIENVTLFNRMTIQNTPLSMLRTLKSKRVKKMKWPIQSADLNPIEHLQSAAKLFEHLR